MPNQISIFPVFINDNLFVHNNYEFTSDAKYTPYMICVCVCMSAQARGRAKRLNSNIRINTNYKYRKLQLIILIN